MGLHGARFFFFFFDAIFHCSFTSQPVLNITIMSEEEIKRNPSDEEEVDDLFGSGEDDEFSKSKANDDGQQSATEEEEEEDDAELKTIDLSLPRHAISAKLEDDVYAIKVPVFLNVEAHPFDPNEFKDQVRQNAEARSNSSMDAKQVKNDLIAEKLLNENTIRWRYSNSGNDEIIKQSNAHFIEWDDGSISLKVGNEMFDFKSLPTTDSFLVKSHDNYEILQNDSILNKTANLLPSSTFTSTHRKLTEALKITQKKDKIFNTITDNDPLLKQKLADENERKSLKLKRQIEQRRRLQEERLERTGSPAVGGYGKNLEEPSYQRFARTYGDDEYDEEDDFVANDEEEIEEEEDDDGPGFDDEEEFDRGAERLRQVKSDGDAKYRKKSPIDEDAEEVEESQQRKKRRIIEDDEDDE